MTERKLPPRLWRCDCHAFERLSVVRWLWPLAGAVMNLDQAIAQFCAAVGLLVLFMLAGIGGQAASLFGEMM